MLRLKKASAVLCAILLVCFIVDQSDVLAQSKRHNFVLEGSLHKSFPLEAGGFFSVENVNGKVEITSWDRNEVEIDVVERNRRRGYEIEIIVNVRRDKIEIVTDHPRRRSWFRGSTPSANYTIRVPKDVEVFAKSTNGSVRVNGTRGPVEARTTNGNVEVGDVSGDVDAHTTNGKIELENITGYIRARTTNSSVYLRNVKSSRVNASTTNGGIRAEIELDEDGKYDFSTTNGNIRVTIPENSKVDVEARCRSRQFRSDFEILSRYDLEDDRWDRWSSRSIRGKINGGGAMLTMRTTNGRIELRKW